MKTIVSALLVLACVSLPARAEYECTALLSAEQAEAVKLANYFGNSYEILTREVDGRRKVVALVGELTHQEALSYSVGTSLYKAFDRTMFSFRRKMDVDDKIFGHVAAPLLTTLFKILAYFDPEERKHTEELIPHIDRYFKNPKPVVPVDPALKPFTDQPILVNNAFYEVRDDEVRQLARMDIQEFLEEAQAEGDLRTVNLERGFRPNVRDWMRSKIFSLNAAAYGLLALSPYVLPHSATTPLAVGWITAFAWQVTGAFTHGYNARPWYRYVFPFIYVGDDRRNEAAVPNILATLAADGVDDAVVIVEERRIRNLRDRLLRLGFTSVEAKPADARWMYRNYRD